MEDSEIRILFKKLSIDISEIKKQTLLNCNKLDNFETKLDEMKKDTTFIPQIFDIVTANGQGIEVLSGRIDKLEK